ncbi:MAG: DUF1841 family protein [Gammaproteobacteria bacterium]
MNRRQGSDVWSKHPADNALQPIENLILKVILAHPEYHALLRDPEQALARRYTPESDETNPFLHMAMHVAIEEQLLADRPAGIARIYTDLRRRYPTYHDAQHDIMDCLVEALWQAQRTHALPDERRYLECLRNRQR